jgi:hypothetical protein
MITIVGKFPLKFLVIGLFAALGIGPTSGPSLPLKNEALPEPPMQRAGLSPDNAGLPADLLSATRRLFDQGLADPRGCEYRMIAVGTGSCWSGDGGVVDCHGWALPSAHAGAQRFAVCWNGLVYPAVRVGEKADLEADVRAVIQRDEDAKAAAARANPLF